MAEKKTIASTLLAKANARVLEQQTGWSNGHHLALLRYAADEAIAQAGGSKEVREKVNAILKAELGKDPEVAYASNWKKLLEKAGDIATAESFD